MMEEAQQKQCAADGDCAMATAEDVESDPSTALMSDASDSEYSSEDGEPGARIFALEDTILIFDWDDTVLPSTWVQEQGLRLDAGSTVSEEQRITLSESARSAIQLLRVAKRHGVVVLVTNAEKGWIELSCQKFMPDLFPSLKDVKIVSARSTYEPQGISSPFDWKYHAFHSEIQGFYGINELEQRRKNCISFGDSAHEREALIRVTENMANCYTKSLKFVERPDVQQLLKQHELIVGGFKSIVQHDGNLDLCIRCP
eukprot:gnl/TRDRNA2_/TRDRNA2_184162_c0_seq1.p1 gnl/TRDRNA2_/TRDRNA2_184162_c0~~gnl/TRDRNA2_/TRDRNA2_184162_c0_seq1.p1  ORF type:complete len:257 (-),score=47.33 gnl/TRDRNA2_/TRDRNA2_184162_c0_seq1:58-828(-)